MSKIFGVTQFLVLNLRIEYFLDFWKWLDKIGKGKLYGNENIMVDRLRAFDFFDSTPKRNIRQITYAMRTLIPRALGVFMSLNKR